MLPINALKNQIDKLVDSHNLVITAPTGSGKSTAVPIWLSQKGPTLIIEPRRVACRALAQHVSKLTQSKLGEEVGYVVRDDMRRSRNSTIVFVTPGIALRMLKDNNADDFTTFVLDEFHERSMENDLLVALLLHNRKRIIILSATIQAEPIREYIHGKHLTAEGRQFPVSVKHVENHPLPDDRNLPQRIAKIIQQNPIPHGDILVFLPGKAEISATLNALRKQSIFEVIPLHGGLSLKEQNKVFSISKRRRIILSTNVAETSITLPQIRGVIDSGLVRRTRYHHGRGYLTLLPISLASANQRAGRAGRLGPGICLRMWKDDTQLQKHSLPEIYRESLTNFVLSAAACGHPDLSLPFLDSPKEYAVQNAHLFLQEIGALDHSLQITERGLRIFQMPIDPAIGRLLIEAEKSQLLPSVLPLCAALTSNRKMFNGRPKDIDDDLREAGCDAQALVQAVLFGQPERHLIDHRALEQSKLSLKRLHAMWPNIVTDSTINRKELAFCIIKAWPTCVHVARVRRGRVSWSNGGTEKKLAPSSAIKVKDTPAIIVLESRAVGKNTRQQEEHILAALPLPLQWIAEAGLGRKKLHKVLLVEGQLRMVYQLIYAGKVIQERTLPPDKQFLHQVAAQAFCQGLWFPEHLSEASKRHQQHNLLAVLRGDAETTTLESWLEKHLQELGIEDTDDLDLLEGVDLLPPPIAPDVVKGLQRNFPSRISTGDATYELVYHMNPKSITLKQISGYRKTAPPESVWPRRRGWTIKWEYKNRTRTLT